MGQMEGMEVMLMEEEEDDNDEVEERESGVEREDMKLENCFPRMVLRVLLVEADDSTRQIVGALLRKCNYKVAAISDGLKAWEILKRRHNSIDLILTELDLPSISGYALLTLIMEDESCKDIPVIIMSSQDSVSMVLKCILKGAADFLIKPIRKNELKNLWRHVWKRLAINPQNQTVEQQNKTEAKHERNPATSHSEDNNVSSSHKSSKFSGKSSDFNGLSWMKHKEETEFFLNKEKLKAKDVKVERVSLPTCVAEDDTGSDGQRSKDGNDSNALRVEEDGSDTGIVTEDGRSGDALEIHTYGGNNIARHELFDSSMEAVDLIGRINEHKSIEKGPNFDRESNWKNTSPELELNLKRPLDSEVKEVNERPILNHSSASAFSWYGTNKKSRTSLDGELPKIQSVFDSSSWLHPFNHNGEIKPNIQVLQSSNCDKFSPHPHIGLGIWATYSNPIQPICTPHKGSTVRNPNLVSQIEDSPFIANPSPQSENGVGASYRNGLQPVKGPIARSPNSALQREESPLLTSPSLQSDPGTHSSNQGCGRAEVVDPSESGTQCNDIHSQNKNNAQGSTSEISDVNGGAFRVKGMNFVKESEDCKPFIHELIKPSMGIHSAEREAALAKFREKRKGRCYEKKVRYQSRKRLAEQRPRVKGQFVRQVPGNQVLADDKP